MLSNCAAGGNGEGNAHSEDRSPSRDRACAACRNAFCVRWRWPVDAKSRSVRQLAVFGLDGVMCRPASGDRHSAEEGAADET